MEPITHFAIGLAGGLLVLTPLVDRYDNSTLAIMSGMWAMIPDTAYFIRQLEPVFAGWWSDVFWMHRSLDALDTGYPHIEALFTTTFLVFVVILLERRGYYQ